MIRWSGWVCTNVWLQQLLQIFG